MRKIILNRVYIHFKGKEYRVPTFAKSTETGELLVIYQAMYGAQEIYARPYGIFISEVDKEKYSNTSQKYRFELKK